MEKADELREALMKKAVGYDAEEVVEEYAESEDELRLVKRKVTKKNVPPDVAAIKILLEEQTGVEELSDGQLESEKLRLLKLLETLESRQSGESGGEENKKGEGSEKEKKQQQRT